MHRTKKSPKRKKKVAKAPWAFALPVLIIAIVVIGNTFDVDYTGVDSAAHEAGYDVAYETEYYETEYISHNLEEATVARVIDGDTLELENGDRVRLIGVNAPERSELGADEATDFVRERVEGQNVWLEADGDDRDRFDRLRRYVWLQIPTDVYDEQQIRAYQLNAMLLEHGHAEVLIIGEVRNEALFRQLGPR
jgi:endonuclease YncB( thermonuclease family)